MKLFKFPPKYFVLESSTVQDEASHRGAFHANVAVNCSSVGHPLGRHTAATAMEKL